MADKLSWFVFITVHAEGLGRGMLPCHRLGAILPHGLVSSLPRSSKDKDQSYGEHLRELGLLVWRRESSGQISSDTTAP